MDLKTSPPSHPNIPIGLATVAGLGSTVTMWLVALITAVLDGDHSKDTRTTLIIGGATLLMTLIGRYSQALVAIIAAKYGVVIPQEDQTNVDEDPYDQEIDVDPTVTPEPMGTVPELSPQEQGLRTTGEHPDGAYEPEGARSGKPLVNPVNEGEEYPRSGEGRFQP